MILMNTACGTEHEAEAIELINEVSLTATVTRLTPTFTSPTAIAKTDLPPCPCNPGLEVYCVIDGDFLSVRPIMSPDNDIIDRTYAYASSANGEREPHHGVEFVNAAGTPVLAAENGTVIYSSNDLDRLFSPWPNFYGNLIILEHRLSNTPIYTLYAHLSKLDVSEGDLVNAGDKIGEVGATGSAIGSHLHFEVRLDPADYSTTVNPELWVPPKPDEGILALRLVDTDGKFVETPCSVQFFPDISSTFSESWDVVLYPVSMQNPENWENAAMGGLLEGPYRIVCIWSGIWQEKWVEIRGGKITLVEFVLLQ